MIFYALYCNQNYEYLNLCKNTMDKSNLLEPIKNYAKDDIDEELIDFLDLDDILELLQLELHEQEEPFI